MIVNDMATVGAQPLMVGMHIASGSGDWFTDEERAEALCTGWARACTEVGASWGGGETPALEGIVNPNTVVLSGSATGVAHGRSRVILGNTLAVGDVLIGLKASGIHANGLTMARVVGDAVGYTVKLPSGRLYGEALLTPTPIYAKLVMALIRAGLLPHYIMNITGHGWRKIMRHLSSDKAYIITVIPDVPEEFHFIQEHYRHPKTGRSATTQQMYATFNQGLGYVLAMARKDVSDACRLAHQLGFEAFEMGLVTEAGDLGKRVEIRPLDITFQGESLQVR